MLAVLFYLACTGLALTVSLLAPILVGLAVGEDAVAMRLGVYLLLGGFVFGAVVLAIVERQRRMPRIGRLSLVTAVWFVLPLVAAIPIMDISQLSLTDSLFEAFSGLTTTGSSVIQSVESWPVSLVFWRVQLQWLGGFLSIITVVLIVAPLGIGGLTSRTRTLVAHLDQARTQGRLLFLISRFAIIYLVMTLLCFLGFFLSGTSGYDGLTLAMTAVSTGGFLPFASSLDTVLNRFGLFVFAVFLLFGATSIFWQGMLLGGEVRRLGQHRESYSVIGLVALLTIAIFFLIAQGTAGDDAYVATAVVEGFLAAASLVATSGVESRPGVFALMPLVIVLFVVFAGASAFSTSGGIKHYRLGGMIVQSWAELDKLIYPHGVRSRKFGSMHHDIDLMKAIWGFFLAAILVIGVGTVLVASSGIEFEAALTATLVNFSTAGPVYNSGWAAPDMPDWPDYWQFSTFSKWVLMLVMLLGRLEVLVIVGLFSLKYWRSH